MNCNANNPCSGFYGKCLDVKITNACNGNCAFCIEKGGLVTPDAPVVDLIKATNTLTDYKKVLVLGGEPLLYPELITYLAGIKDIKEEIYITTNGSLLTESMAHALSDKITAINISIHHFNSRENQYITGVDIDSGMLMKSIEILKKDGVKVRINTNLMKGGIDSLAKARSMAIHARQLGADTIRFAELQNCPELFVAAENIFSGIHENPYYEGCEQTIDLGVKDITAQVRLTCGFVNPTRKKPVDNSRPQSKTKVMYPNGTVYKGWVAPASSSDVSCHSSHRSKDRGCHPVIQIERGCH